MNPLISSTRYYSEEICVFLQDYINRNFFNKLCISCNYDTIKNECGIVSYEKKFGDNGIFEQYILEFYLENRKIIYITDSINENGFELPTFLEVKDIKNTKQGKNMKEYYTFQDIAEKLVSNIFGELRFKIDNKMYEVTEIDFLSETIAFKNEEGKIFKFPLNKEITKNVSISNHPSTKNHKLIEIFDYEFDEYVDNIGIYDENSNLIDIDSQRVKISSKFEFKEPNDIKLYIFLNINNQKIRYVWNYFENRIIFNDYSKKLIAKKLCGLDDIVLGKPLDFIFTCIQE